MSFPPNIDDDSTEDHHPPNRINSPEKVNQRVTYTPVIKMKEYEIHSDWQLTRIQKELMRVYYREASLKGFKINRIPDYIQAKMKSRPTIGYCYNMKDKQYKDDRFWFYRFARDATAYVGAYREAVDEIRQYKDELWLLLMSAQSDRRLKLEATKELHSLTKTSVLLLRDLPFITNISQYYDPSKLDPTGRDKDPFRPLTNPKDEITSKKPSEIGDLKLMNREIFDRQNTNIVQSVLDRLKTNRIYHSNNDANFVGFDNDDDQQQKGGDNNNNVVDNKIQKVMTEQLKILGYETDEVKKEKALEEQKQAEERFAEHQLAALEKNLTEAEGNAALLEGIKEKYEKSLAYLDQIVDPETRANISRLRSLTEEKDEGLV